MDPDHRILAATDLSAPARHAVHRAFHLTARTGSELHVLHAMELHALDTLRDLLGADLSSTKSALEADARARLATLVDDKARNLGIHAYSRIVAGAAVTVIANEAEALDAGLIVLGARGESFLRHAMLGSTASRLLRRSVMRPVLVVKQPPHVNYRNVLVAVDFSATSQAAIQAARRWAPDAAIVLLHAYELPFEGKLRLAGVDEQVIRQYIGAGIETRRNRLHELASSVGLAPEDYVAQAVHGDASQLIIAMEQEYSADLVVAGKHGAHVTDALLLGSVTKHVLAYAQSDVLVVAAADGVPAAPAGQT